MKLFQRLLVAPAALGLISPLAANATEINLNDIANYSDVESIELTNSFDDIELNKSPLLAGGEGLVDTPSYDGGSSYDGGFSDTTTLDGKAIFTLMGTDHAKVQAGADDGIDSLAAAYTYQMNLNTSFTGDDNLYVRIKTGNHAGNSVDKEFGTYLSSGNGNGDALKVDKIWYTFPVGEYNTVWVGPKIENYYMHGTTPSIYKPVTKQFTLGGNGEAYGASTNSGAGWAYKADNGFAVSSNFVSQQNASATKGLLTNQAATSWASQVGYTADRWSVSALLNQKYNGWSDTYYHSLGHSPASGGNNFNSIGVRAWWRPAETGTAMPSVSLGADTTDYDSAPGTSDNSTAYFVGFTWQDAFQADDRIGVAFGQPTTNEDETVTPFAYEAYYSFKANDSVTITPAVFGGSDRNGTAREDIFGAVLETTFKF